MEFYFVRKKSDHELARSEYVQHSPDQLRIVLVRRVRLEANVGAGRLRGYVNGEVVTLKKCAYYKLSCVYIYIVIIF